MKKTQLARIRAALEAGESLTPLEALDRFGCFRLADVVYKLKKTGMVINTEMVDAMGAHGPATFARYRLDKGAPGPCPNGGARPAGEGPAARGAAADCVIECNAYAPAPEVLTRPDNSQPGFPVGGFMPGATFKGIRLDSLAENLAWILQELKDQDKAFSLGEKDHPHLICHGVVERLSAMLDGKL